MISPISQAAPARLLELRPLKPAAPIVNPGYVTDTYAGGALPDPTHKPGSLSERYTNLKLRLRAMGWTVYFGAKGFFSGMQPKAIPDMSKTGRVLHKLLPGETVAGLFGKLYRTQEELAIPTGPVPFPVDPRQYMPNLVFVGGKIAEDSFPVAAAFDGDNDVNNNRRHYRHGSMTGDQMPTVYVNTRMKGRFAVVQYHTYYVDNKRANYHDHDWEGFSVYLENKGGRWEPSYLATSWHHTGEMIPWNDLEFDPNGRPYVYVERGAHGSLALRKGVRPENDGGWTLRPDGSLQQRGGTRMEQPGLRFYSPDPNVIGALAPEPTPKGTVLEEDYRYNYRVFGFIPYEKSDVSPGPSRRRGWENPLHPSRFGYAQDDGHQHGLMRLAPLTPNGADEANTVFGGNPKP